MKLDYNGTGHVVAAYQTSLTVDPPSRFVNTSDKCYLFVVVVELDNQITPWCVSLYRQGDTERGNGIYCRTWIEAWQKFTSVVERYSR